MLRRETHFRFNRFYLLFSVVISMIIPLPAIPLNTGNAGTGFAAVLQTVQVDADSVFLQQSTMPFTFYIILIYFTGVAVFSGRFIARFISLFLLRRQCVTEKRNGKYIAICGKEIAPFSFFRTIYMNERTTDHAQFDKIIMHETVHIRQFHSLDIIFAELICVLTWFNPVSWMIIAALKETHEYLADSGVSEQTPGSAEYFLLLIRNVIGVQPGLANNLNKSLIIKRLKMMKKPRSGRFSMLKALPVLPLLVLLLLAFSCQSKADEPTSQKPGVTQNEAKNTPVDVMPEFPGGQDALTKFIMDNVKYPKAAKEKGIQGKVMVSFTVTSTGKVENIKVVEAVNDLLDAEAIRVVSAMPNWTPGKSKGTNVDVEMKLPISFKLA
jgi:TonB family protein